MPSIATGLRRNGARSAGPNTLSSLPPQCHGETVVSVAADRTPHAFPILGISTPVSTPLGSVEINLACGSSSHLLERSPSEKKPLLPHFFEVDGGFRGVAAADHLDDHAITPVCVSHAVSGRDLVAANRDMPRGWL